MRVCASIELFVVGMTDRSSSLAISLSSACLECRCRLLRVPSRVPSTSYVSACACFILFASVSHFHFHLSTRVFIWLQITLITSASVGMFSEGGGCDPVDRQ